jgi:hypothetical protein
LKTFESCVLAFASRFEQSRKVACRVSNFEYVQINSFCARDLILRPSVAYKKHGGVNP